jgi:hypothetical protein
MNIKRYIIASIAVFAAFQVMDFVVHSVILMSSYAALASIWRPDMMSLMWIMWITGLAVSFLFVFIFCKGYENKGLMEGVRFGLIAGLFLCSNVWGQYVIYPVPLVLAVKWFVFYMIESMIAGLITAAIYRPRQ